MQSSEEEDEPDWALYHHAENVHNMPFVYLDHLILMNQNDLDERDMDWENMYDEEPEDPFEDENDDEHSNSVDETLEGEDKGLSTAHDEL